MVVFAAVCSRIEEVLMRLTPCLRACQRTHKRSDTPRSPADPWSADDATRGLRIIVHAPVRRAGWRRDQLQYELRARRKPTAKGHVRASNCGKCFHETGN